MNINKQTGITAQWQTLVSEAESVNGVALDTHVESYLVHTLVRYTARPDMAARIMALDYLEAMQNGGAQRQDQLRDVGDQCLLFAGLFPLLARRRHVKVSYFVDIGRSAYQDIAETEHDWSDVYAELATEFVTLMDTLHAIRKMGGNHELDAMGAYELWSDCQSENARQKLAEFTHDEHEKLHAIIIPQNKVH